MPRVILTLDTPLPDGSPDTITTYLCDWPGCGNIAVHSLGCIAELRVMAAVCADHIPKRDRRTTT